MTPADEKVGTMTTVAAQMSVTLRQRLQDIADRDDRKLSYVIRQAVQEYVDRHEDGLRPESKPNGGVA